MAGLREFVLTTHLGSILKEPVRRAFARVGYEITPARPDAKLYMERLLQRLEIELLVDVGANQGQFATAARRDGFQGRMLSFEPLSDAFALLESRAQRDPLWEVRRLALGRAPGMSTLQVAANSVSSSLLAVEPLHVASEPLSRTIRTEEVSTSTLDRELTEPAEAGGVWLKLDVQGTELDVLAGGRRAIESVKLIQCELSLRQLYEEQSDYLDVLQFLRAQGFTPVRIVEGFADPESGDALQFDVIAARTEIGPVD